MPTITYHAATAEDAEALALLRYAMELERHPEEASRANWPAYREAHIEATRAQMAAGLFAGWLAEAEDVPVACVVLLWWPMSPNLREPRRRRGLVTNVYTAPAYRKQGIARRLMETLVAHAREQGVSRLILWASDMGRPLYTDLGFAPSRGLEINL